MTKWVKRCVREARAWPEFKRRVDELFATYPQKPYWKWVAIKKVAQEMPAARWTDGEASWTAHLAGYRRTRKARRTAAIADRVVKSREKMRAALDREESEQRVLDRERRAKRRMIASETTKNYRKLQTVKLSLRRQEANIAKREAYIKLLEERRKKLELEAVIMAEEKQAAEVTVVVKKSGPMDLVRDVQWVYENLSELVLVNENGVRIFDVELLAQAPSQGSVAIAQYARDKPDLFLEKFVLRCMPKDANTEGGESEDEIAERLDPTLKTLEKYFKEQP